MPNIEQFPNNQVPEQENNEKTPESELEAENNKKVEEKESWLSRNKRKLVFSATAYGMLTAAVQGKELKNTADEEFSKGEKDKTELLQDNVENQENPLFPVLTKVRLGKLEKSAGDNNLNLLQKLQAMAKLNGWRFDQKMIYDLIKDADLQEKQETIEIVVVDPIDLGLGPDNTIQDVFDQAKLRGLSVIKNPAEVIASMMFMEPENINLSSDSVNNHNYYKFGMEPVEDVPAGEYRAWSSVGVNLGLVKDNNGVLHGEFRGDQRYNLDNYIDWENDYRKIEAQGKYKDKTMGNGQLPYKLLFQRNVQKVNYDNKK